MPYTAIQQLEETGEYQTMLTFSKNWLNFCDELRADKLAIPA